MKTRRRSQVVEGTSTPLLVGWHGHSATKCYKWR